MSDVGHLLDKAAHGSREQLYAALQAACAELVEAQYRPGWTLDAACVEIERRFDMGMTYGSEFVQ